MTEPIINPSALFKHKEVSMSVMASALEENLYDKPRIPSRFSTWDRLNLERLAEELVAELNATKEELRVALKAYRKSVKDCDK